MAFVAFCSPGCHAHGRTRRKCKRQKSSNSVLMYGAQLAPGVLQHGCREPAPWRQLSDEQPSGDLSRHSTCGHPVPRSGPAERSTYPASPASRPLPGCLGEVRSCPALASLQPLRQQQDQRRQLEGPGEAAAVVAQHRKHRTWETASSLKSSKPGLQTKEFR